MPLPLAYYLFAGFFQIKYPGFYYDEAFQLLPAVNFAQENCNYPYLRILDLKIGNNRFPLMRHHYGGMVKAYPLAVVFKIFGVGWLVTRITMIVLGLFILVLVYLWARQLFDIRVAFLALLLLSTDPNFIFPVRVDLGLVVLMLIFKMVSLLLLLRWWRKGGVLSFVMAFFSLGLGVWDKANFFWFVGALIASGFLVGGSGLFKKLTWGALIGGVGAFILGSSPFSALNIMRSGVTFSRMVKPDPRTQRLLMEVGRNLSVSFRVFWQTINGHWLQRIFIGSSPLHLFLPYLLGFSVIVFLGISLKIIVAHRLRLKKVSFVFSLMTGILLLTMLTPQTWGGHHFLMVYPFPHIFCGAVLSSLITLRSPRAAVRKVLSVMGIAVLLLAIYSNVSLTFAVHRAFARDKLPWWAWSNAIYDLGDYLSNLPGKTILCLDWGFYRNLAVVTEGKVKLEEKYENFRSGQADNVFKKCFPNNYYLYLLSHRPLFHQGRKSFEKALKDLGYQKRLERSFRDGRGKEIYFIFKVSPLADGEKKSHI